MPNTVGRAWDGIRRMALKEAPEEQVKVRCPSIRPKLKARLSLDRQQARTDGRDVPVR